MLPYRVFSLRVFLLLGCLAVAGGVAAQPSQSAQQQARAVVERLHAKLIAVMKQADDLDYAGRYRALEPTIQRTFDLPAIARLTVRGYWDEFSAHQQQAFIDAFTRLSIAEYARRFDGYGGETFKVVGGSGAAGGSQRVNTELVKPDGDTVSLDYLLRADDGQWRIVNVIAQGVSDLALKRGQYVGVLRKQGVEAFMRRIQDKADASPAASPKGSE